LTSDRLQATAPRSADSQTRSASGLRRRFSGAERIEIASLVLALVMLVAAMIIEKRGADALLVVALCVVSAVLSSRRTAAEGARKLLTLSPDINLLMFIAAIGSAATGHAPEGAFLLLLFGIGAAGEHLAMERARSAILALTQLAPETAERLREDGSIERVGVEFVVPDDLVLVRPFDRISVDGEVTDGTSSVDQSGMTGESVPVDCGPGSPVFAGTMNGAGTLRVRVLVPSSQTMISRIAHIVEEAEAHKSRTHLFMERFERWYVPLVIVMALGVVTLPPMLGDGEARTWFLRGMAFLAAASPCALAIGTPAAVLCGLARAARLGALVKGGRHLERLSDVRVVAYDKTGTLTIGHPEVQRVSPVAGVSEEEVLSLAAAVDRHVEHPLAAAIVRAAKARGAPVIDATDVQQAPGFGASGRVDGVLVRVGRNTVSPIPPEGQLLVEEGLSLVCVVRGERALGFIGLGDVIRPDAAAAVQSVRGDGISVQVMLTGDHERSAQRVAQIVGIDRVVSDLRPDEKLREIEKLAREHGPVAMVGDGVNDAPALAGAAVGIAMGAAGSPIALETADVALLSDRLPLLPVLLRLARATRAMIRQNVIIAVTVMIIVAPLAALGVADIGPAVAMHEGSTVFVVLNALRLLRFRASPRS